MLFIEAAGNLWGSERALLDLLDEMSEKQVAVCCPAGRPLVAELAARGITTYPYLGYELHLQSRWQRISSVLGIVRACAAFKPDVIHLNQSGSFRLTLPAASLFGLPVTAHVRIFEDADYLSRVRPSTRRLAGIVAISKAVADYIRSFPSLSQVPVHTVYDAYAQTIQAPSVRTSSARIVCLGRIVPIKGQDVLIEAIPLVLQTRPDVHCHIVGAGRPSYVAALQRRLAEAGGAEAVSWPGFVRDVRAELAAASVLVCPSYKEPLGRVIFEAWDAGVLPVVCADSGGAAEAVIAADGGVLYARQDARSLAEAILTALELAPAERERRIENGRSWMKDNCDPKTYSTVVEEILLGAIKRSVTA